MKTKVLISKKQWARGPGRGANALLISREQSELPEGGFQAPPRIHNTMCCLGFVCLVRGVPPSAMRGVSMPDGASARIDKPIDGLTEPDDDEETGYKVTDFAERAAEINDDVNIDDEQRIVDLQDLCAEPDSKFEFVFVE